MVRRNIKEVYMTYVYKLHMSYASG